MNPDRPYRLVYNGVILDHLRRLMRRAANKNVQPRLKRTLIQIEHHLETAPTSWGDPTHRLHSAQMTVYHRIFDEMMVSYAVHDTEMLVIPGRFLPVFNHPLVPPSEDN